MLPSQDLQDGSGGSLAKYINLANSPNKSWQIPNFDVETRTEPCIVAADYRWRTHSRINHTIAPKSHTMMSTSPHAPSLSKHLLSLCCISRSVQVGCYTP